MLTKRIFWRLFRYIEGIVVYKASVLSVMIASPSDVQEERDEIRRILHDLNDINARAQQIVMLPVGWDTHSAPSLEGRAQDIINENILEHCDILIGVFWTRLGTPTGSEESGTVEEIKRHIGAGKPAMICFSEKLVAPAQLDNNQYRMVGEFKEWCKQTGIIWRYSTLDEFRESFRRQIQIIIRDNDYIKSNLESSTRTIGEEVKSGDQVMMQLTEAAWNLLNEAAKGDGTIIRLPALSGMQILAND